jgi:hypothetical protein
MGFEDFFDIDLLRSHRGYHVLHMEVRVRAMRVMVMVVRVRARAMRW